MDRDTRTFDHATTVEMRTGFGELGKLLGLKHKVVTTHTRVQGTCTSTKATGCTIEKVTFRVVDNDARVPEKVQLRLPNCECATWRDDDDKTA